MAFLLLANSSTEVDENQEIELTIGNLSILVGPSGSTRLSDSTKPNPSTSEHKTVATVESLEGSSSEVNSPVSLGEAQIAEGDEIREKFDLEAKAFKTHNGTKDFAAGNSDISKRVHQLCIIITEAEKENNIEGSKGVDRQVDKIKENNKKENEKVHVSAGEWRIIMSAINHGTRVPEGSRREVLMGYQYALHQHRKKLREERDMFFQDTITVCQGKSIGMIIVRIQSTAGKGVETQSKIEGQRRKAERKGTREVLLHS
jgi:hypothetical protein